jgi:autotransporter translocation and assembly factor TamB
MQARFVNSSIFVDSFTGKIGAGQLVGRLQATEVFDPMRTNVTVIGGFSNVYLEPLDQLSMVVEGETRLNYEPEGGQRIEGDIRLLSLLYENNLSLKRVLAIAKDYMAGTGMVTPVASTIRTKDESVQTKLDLHVSAENNLIVDTSFAQAEMRSELWIRGTPEHPLVQGSVSVIDGGYGFRSSHFDIVRGEVAFTEKAQQSDPKLDFLAESTATAPSGGEYRIQMFIRGTLSEPEVSFASDGGLSQNQVVQLLGAGANLDALSFSAGGSSSENLFDLINPASDITLDNRLKGLAGFSDISIAPSVSAATGELVPKVMAVRPLMRQVDLQLQTQLSRDPESEATIKYPLTPYLRLIAGWQNRALTEDVDTTSGAWLAGVGFKKSFPGTSILPFAED